MQTHTLTLNFLKLTKMCETTLWFTKLSTEGENDFNLFLTLKGTLFLFKTQANTNLCNADHTVLVERYRKESSGIIIKRKYAVVGKVNITEKTFEHQKLSNVLRSQSAVK